MAHNIRLTAHHTSHTNYTECYQNIMGVVMVSQSHYHLLQLRGLLSKHNACSHYSAISLYFYHVQDEQGSGLTDKEIEDEVDTFMFGGHDTTASGISWMLYNMASHPEYQQKCRDEVDVLFSNTEKDHIEW